MPNIDQTDFDRALEELDLDNFFVHMDDDNDDNATQNTVHSTDESEPLKKF